MPEITKTTPDEQYGTSVINQVVPVKYGRLWWQFWKPWKVVYMTSTEMQSVINREMRACLTKQ